ncbi:unnamed protein product [Dibothriocephalus latus]|uniref:Uncharacterized protein n=1 Tax=Dibothriocephalus latus TaxID=60516 RepID=A0A3P6PQC3_DIBLA|nr:unnamed protein product [Dibothriocephalus latus]
MMDGIERGYEGDKVDGHRLLVPMATFLNVRYRIYLVQKSPSNVECGLVGLRSGATYKREPPEKSNICTTVVLTSCLILLLVNRYMAYPPLLK